jgi:segregation and condensation protein A
MNDSSLRIQLSTFEGPLDLLLHLCRRQEVAIVDLSIAEITSQYLETMGLMEELDIEVGASFVVMASTLCYLKSRELLPRPPDEDEDEEDEDEIRSRADLIRRLLEYKKYKDAAENLVSRDLLDRDTFVREPPEDDERPEGELQGSLFHLMDALRQLLDRRSIEPAAVHIKSEPFSLRERIRWMWLRVRTEDEVDFVSLFDRDATRMDILTTFLALLELVRMGAFGVEQREAHGEVRILRKWAQDQDLPDLSDVALADESPDSGSQPGLPLVEEHP